MRKQIFYILLISTVLMSQACKKNEEKAAAPTDSASVAAASVTKSSFGALPDGRAVERYTLRNKHGVEMDVISYGGIVTSLRVPDRNGVVEDVVLGYDSLAGYLKATPYFGAIVGRYGNRIAKGKFTLDGKEYTLVQNNNGQHLHGGTVGFDKVLWTVEEIASTEGVALKLTYLSKDMEEGYPGNLQVEVRYTLTDNNEWKIAYTATTDKKTVLNLTNHTYFNLTGGAKRDILDHEVMIDADKFVPVDKVLIPTGKLMDVAGTPFDFRTPTKVGARIDEKHEQLQVGGGYDHCWVFNGNDAAKVVASVYDSTSGRLVEMTTSEPAVQFYCGNFLDGSITGKGGVVYKRRYGLCLETEHYPDSPNQPAFPPVVLNPGETYSTQTQYRFATK